MSAQLSPTPVFHADDNNGIPLQGGLLYSYAAGTSTPQVTYTDSTQGTANTNPVVLNARGEASVWLDPTLTYKLLLTDKAGNTIPGYPVDNIIGGLNITATSVGMLINPRTTAEINLGINPTNWIYTAFPFVDPRRYGADPTGSIASDTAIGIALQVVGPSGTNGGTILFGAGTYLFTNAWNLNRLSGVSIKGVGCATAGAGPGTLMKYSGTGPSHWIQMTSALGCSVQDMFLSPTSSSFTGAIVRCGNDGSHGDASSCFVQNVFFDGIAGSNNCYHLNLDQVTRFDATRCTFAGGATSIKGQDKGGASYSIGVTFDKCNWTTCATVPINYLGTSWAIRNCVFEQLSTGAAGAIVCDSTAKGIALIFDKNWCGDVTNSAPAGNWINCCLAGAMISGNEFGGNATSNNTTAIELSASTGVTIVGNHFTTLNLGINFAVSGNVGIVVKGNTADSVTTFWTGTASNIAQGQLDYSIGAGITPPSGHALIVANGYRCNSDGSVEMWGLFSPASNGSNTVTFSAQVGIAFPNNCFAVVATLSAVAATTATIYVSGLSKTGFTATVADGVSTTDSFYWWAIGN